MRKPLKPKSEIVTDLSRVFRAHGFDGATLTKLVEETGLERASLYHHFPNGKADMAEAVLLQALLDLEADVINFLKEEGDAKAKLKRMFNAVEAFYNNGNDVCFITIFSLGHQSKNIDEMMSGAIRTWLKYLEKTLADSKVDDPKKSAQQLLSTIQGGLILARTLNDPSVFRNSLKPLRVAWL